MLNLIKHIHQLKTTKQPSKDMPLPISEQCRIINQQIDEEQNKLFHQITKHKYDPNQINNSRQEN